MFTLWIKGRVRRLYTSLGDEATSFVVSALFFFVFLYVAKDFLQESLGLVGASLQAAGLSLVAKILLLAAGCFSSFCLLTPLDWQRLEGFTVSLGSKIEVNSRLLRGALSIAVVCIGSILIWFFLGLSLEGGTLEGAMYFALGAALAFVYLCFSLGKNISGRKTVLQNFLQDKPLWLQKLHGWLQPSALVFLSAVLSLLAGFAFWLVELHPLLWAVSVWVCMLPLNLALQLALTTDLKTSWLGRNLGTTHFGFQLGWHKLVFLVGSVSCFFYLLVFVLLKAEGVTVGFFSTLETVFFSTLGAVFSSLVLAPATVYLLDPFRPVSRFVVCSFLSLICLTLSMAHPLGFLSVFLIAGFAESQQAGHFYRALWH